MTKETIRAEINPRVRGLTVPTDRGCKQRRTTADANNRNVRATQPSAMAYRAGHERKGDSTMSMKTISFLEGENKIKIGQEVFFNIQDTEQWVSLMGYGIEVTQVNGDISLAIYKEDEWNYGSNNLLFTIEQKETAQ
jgi:hypothetical protein